MLVNVAAGMAGGIAAVSLTVEVPRARQALGSIVKYTVLPGFVFISKLLGDYNYSYGASSGWIIL
jgi:hypothetical protein